MCPQPTLLDKNDDPEGEAELGMYSVLEMVPYSGDVGAANKLLNISNKCDSTSLIVFSDTQSDVEKLLDIGGPSVRNILDKTFYESQATRIITTVQYPSDVSSMAFTHPSCLIT